MIYRHYVNGQRYESTEYDGKPIASLAEYKRIVREAYGNLRGVTFEVVSDGR